MMLTSVDPASLSSKATRSKEKLKRFLQMASRPSGIRYLMARSRAVVAQLFNGKIDPTGGPNFQRRANAQLSSLRDGLGVHVRNTIRVKTRHADLLYVGNIVDLAPGPWRGARLEHIPDPSQSGAFRDFNVMPPRSPRSLDSVLIICATAGFMSVWDRIQEDLDRYFSAGWQQVLVVLITDGFRPLDFAGHSYLLSLLLNNFPRRKYLPHLDVLLAKGSRTVRAGTDEQETGQESSSPKEFSALVIGVEPRAKISEQHS